MKKHYLALLAVVFMISSAFTGVNNVEKEKDAIKTVIKKQTQASMDRNYDVLASCWIQDETPFRINVSKNGFNKHDGWSVIGKRYKDGIKNNPEPSKATKKYENFKIKVYKESAWAVFEESTFNAAGELINKAIGTRFLEKDNGKWKIVYMGIVSTKSFE